jgi:hypothetical protein
MKTILSVVFLVFFVSSAFANGSKTPAQTPETQTGSTNETLILKDVQVSFEDTDEPVKITLDEKKPGKKLQKSKKNSQNKKLNTSAPTSQKP